MKKIIAILMALTLLATACVLAGCNNHTDIQDDKLSVVTTIFPEYDWVKNILGDKADRAELTMLLDNGVDLHSYQPTVDDMVKISNCDLFIYVGGESDGWVEDALKNPKNPNRKVINLLDVLGDAVKNEESVEGMEEHEHEHDHGDEELTAEDIKDRTLSDFAGEWKSLYPYLMRGELDAYCEHKAEEDGDDTTTKETYLEKYKASWQCDAVKIKVDGSTITFTYTDGKTVSATYTYAGYQPKLNSEGKIGSVRYQFTTDSADAPKYVQFNDHGHEPGEAEHFHVYFGNDGFDALMNSATNPFFVKDALTVDEILDELMGHSHEHEHEEEKDEHVWLSLRNAKVICLAIAEQLSALDPDNKDAYAKNLLTYTESLTALDKEYRKAVEEGSRKTLLFGDRFPFRYLVNDYGLDYFAAFSGCSAETEASFETITFLAGKVDELELPCVLTIEGANHKIAQTIVQNTKAKNQQVLTMDSMQSTTSQNVKDGASYLSIMRKNLEVLKTALR